MGQKSLFAPIWRGGHAMNQGAGKAPPPAPFSVSFTGFAHGKAASSPRAPRLRHPS